MIHPLLHLIATRPQLIAEHTEAYAELIGDELGRAATMWKLRFVLVAIGLGLVAVAVVLTGVALMLWAVVPPAEMHAPWALIVAPLTPLVIALGCLARASKSIGSAAFADLKEQMRADIAMLRQVSAA